jgi:hypothetical protein
MSDTDEDLAFMAKKAAMKAEADALIANPEVHTPTEPGDADEAG